MFEAYTAQRATFWHEYQGIGGLTPGIIVWLTDMNMSGQAGSVTMVVRNLIYLWVLVDIKRRVTNDPRFRRPGPDGADHNR